MMKKYHKPMMATAYIWANQSSCARKQVGAILSKKGRIISNGYNGTVVGADNCCELPCKECGGLGKILHYEGSQECARCQGTGMISSTEVVHAEANALTFAAKHGLKTKGCSMYITLSPCIECSKLMIQAGIKKVFFSESYRDDAGVQFLRKHGVKVKKYII